MTGRMYVPDSLRSAGTCMRKGLSGRIAVLSEKEFVRVWCSLFYLFPHLHPDDGFEGPESGWPKRLRALAVEAWRRADIGEISDDQLYPSDAQWAGICDRMLSLDMEVAERRASLAARFGDHANA